MINSNFSENYQYCSQRLLILYENDYEGLLTENKTRSEWIQKRLSEVEEIQNNKKGI